MSLSLALFTDSQSRVLRWLFGQPERSYHLNELLRLTGLGSASLQREINRLVDAGLVTAERIGNQRRFQANDKSPVFEELVALVRKTLGVEPMLREALAPLHPQHAWLFGSVAKRTDTAGSDVDVLIVAKGLTLSKVLKALVPVEPLVGRKINPTLYTPAEFERRRAEAGSFVNRVLSQTVVSLTGEPLEPEGAR